jgi:hypothetical protein
VTHTRRVVVGLDDQGRSAVVADGRPGVSVTRPNGAVVTEIWRQDSLPAEVATTADLDEGGMMQPLPPPHGISVRVFTLPPDLDDGPRVTEQDLAGAFGSDNVASSAAGQALARTPSVYVAAVLSGRAYLVLESSEVLLEAGDSFVLPGSLHGWRNPFAETAVMLATVLPLDAEA